MSEQFKTCLFGGFSKEDVVKFIEEQSRQHREEMTALSDEAASLREQNAQLEDALRVLHGKAAVFQQNSQSVKELEDRVAVLTADMEALQQENEALRGPAQAYQEVKEHIAEIEISAHRRTEEFRAQAIARLRAYIQQQRDWCNEQKGRYAGMNEDVLQTLHRCEQMVENSDDQAFDRMLARLQELDENLDK